MKNIEIQRIAFTINDLRCLEEVERVFFLQAGGLLQEVISLQKYAYMSSHGSENQLERVAENSQSMYFCQLLAATLFEAWKSLGSNDRYRSDEVADVFLAEIMELARAFVEYTSGCISIMLIRVIKEAGLKSTVEHLDVPTIHECRLRYFMAGE